MAEASVHVSLDVPSFPTDLRTRSHFGATSSRRGSPPRQQSPPLNSSRVKTALRESISSSKLYRDLSPTRVFAAAQAVGDPSRTSLPSLFSPGKTYLQSLRPSYDSFNLDGAGEDASRQPKLLQRLESLLEEKLGLVERVGAASKGFAATQMRTDAYRQVFDAFLHSFTTYRSLLMRVKHEYDIALDDALASVYDNVHMRAELAVTEERLDAAVREAQRKALEDAALSRKEIQDEVEQQEAVAAESERRCQAAEAEIHAIRANIQKLKEEEVQLARVTSEAKLQLLKSSTFKSPQLELLLEQQSVVPSSNKD